MRTITGSTGATVSYSVAGSGPPLVLVHGGFSDHETNWSFVAPAVAGAVHRVCHRAPRARSDRRHQWSHA